ALDAAARNFDLNLGHPAVAATRHEQIVGNAFDELARLNAEGRGFDMVILDPPAFAKTQAETAGALAAYARLTRLGVSVLRPGGVLVQASCSSRVDADAFFQAVNRAAAGVGRPLREIERTGHALDHPVRFREGAYLKCLFATAE
ncbi:MAG: class I SAM-dependent rRNA methyltransferase, partial [Chloroflexi bacterium HGW-Chloroflexi-1]